MPGATLFLQNSQDIRVGGRQGNAQYQYTLQTQDLTLLAQWGPRVLARLSRLPQLADVSSDQQNSGLSANVIIDRDTASRLGLTAQAVDSALYDAFGQRQVSTIYKAINQYHVVLALQQQWWENPAFLNAIYVQTPRGVSDSPVHLRPFLRKASRRFHCRIRDNFLPLPFHSTSRTASRSATPPMPFIRAEVDIGMPTTLVGKFAGTAQAFQGSMANQPVLIATALLAVYIILGMLYESLIHPLTIISTLPSAGVGALIALVLFRTELTIVGVDWNHSAHRNREEKRDHDDRLRSGSRAQ